MKTGKMVQNGYIIQRENITKILEKLIIPQGIFARIEGDSLMIGWVKADKKAGNLLLSLDLWESQKTEDMETYISNFILVAQNDMEDTLQKI